MSSCGNCDCSVKTGCSKGNSYGVAIVESEKSTVETIGMEVPAAENYGKCGCGINCRCTNCTCGH